MVARGYRHRRSHCKKWALEGLKKQQGLKGTGKGGVISQKNTKKERVERYLGTLMKSSDFTVDDLMNLTVYDLFGNSELEGIGKTTLSSGISAFKKKFLKIEYNEKAADESIGLKSETEVVPENGSFEDAFITAIEKEDEREKTVESNNTEQSDLKLDGLDEKEVLILKSMINQFKTGGMLGEVSKENMELIELKHAMRHFGIDYKTILEQYRRNVEQ